MARRRHDSSYNCAAPRSSPDRSAVVGIKNRFLRLLKQALAGVGRPAVVAAGCDPLVKLSEPIDLPHHLQVNVDRRHEPFETFGGRRNLIQCPFNGFFQPITDAQEERTVGST